MQTFVRLLNVINTGSIWPLVGLLVLAYPVASRAWRTHPRIYTWSLRSGAAAFALYITAMLVAVGQIDGAFWLSIFWRGMLAGALVGVITAIAIGVWAILTHPLCSWLTKQRRTREDGLRRQRDSQRALVEAERTAEIEQREAPAREEARRARERAACEAAELKSMQDQLRYDLRIRYQSLRRDVQALFSPDEFNEMLDHALAPASADEIHRRVAKLEELLAALRSPSSAPGGSLEDLALDYRRRREEVANSSLPDREKDKLVRWLNREENQRLHQFVMEASQ